MPNFAANLSMLFTEHDFLDRFDAAAQAGFKAVEFQFPYAWDKAAIRERLERNGLRLVLHNLPAGDWAAGDRGIACLPDRVEEFREGVQTAIDYARALGCPLLNCLAGRAPAGADAAELRHTFVRNLRYTADALQQAGIRLVMEAINTRVDIPGFYLNHTQQALDLIRDVGSDNLGVQYDIYHMQVMEGDLARTIERHSDRIWHLQVADNPGRHEPGTGEINYPFLFDFIDRIGYQGAIGAEYIPQGKTLEGLGWFAPYRAV